MTLDDVISARIDELLKERGLKRVWLERVLGLTQPAVSDRFRGRTRWDKTDLVDLADALCVSVDEVLRPRSVSGGVVRSSQWSTHRALAESGWRVEVMRGGSGTITHPVIAVAPGCPTERHPTRDCRCRVFRSRAHALTYVAEQLAQDTAAAAAS